MKHLAFAPLVVLFGCSVSDMQTASVVQACAELEAIKLGVTKDPDSLQNLSDKDRGIFIDVSREATNECVKENPDVRVVQFDVNYLYSLMRK